MITGTAYTVVTSLTCEKGYAITSVNGVLSGCTPCASSN